MNAIERYEQAVGSGERLTEAQFAKLWKAAYKAQHSKPTPRIVWAILVGSLVISLLQAIR